MYNLLNNDLGKLNGVKIFVNPSKYYEVVYLHTLAIGTIRI